ncbi:MAG: ABC transporter permease [Candidatus Marinimicrobia bacterium]|nr:ABC transporter permease [Candidatus Neomarinimicrobiota bacterium]MDD5582742.1 ABC transporter permease [Candidatus Neomarinimicrobiota bacterium]
MKLELYLAYRSLARSRGNRFIPFIRALAIIGMIIGTAALAITAGILNGFEENLVDKVTGFDAHIRISSLHDPYFTHDSSFVYNLFSTTPHIRRIAPYFDEEIIVRYQNRSEGILLECMDESDFRHILMPSKMPSAGTVDFSGNSIYLGKGVADVLNVSTGSMVDLLLIKGMPSPLNPPKIIPVTVTGIFSTGISDYDKSLGYAGLHLGEMFLSRPNKITGYQILLEDTKYTENVNQALSEKLPYPLYSMTWKERHYTLFRWLETQKLPIFLIFGLIALVAAVNIISTLIMIVLVKEKEIAVLKSMGMPPRRIKKMFLIDGLLISTVASVIGVLFSLFIEWGQMTYGWFAISSDVYFINRVPISINPLIVLFVIAMAIFLSLLASVYPAAKASAVKPVDILRYE